MTAYRRASLHAGDTVPDWTPDPDDDFLAFYCTTDNSLYVWDGSAWSILGGGGHAFPVGAVYTSVISTNPATTLGYGTWAAFGAGRVPVGFASGDTDFGTVEGTGGEKTHVLTTAEMPSHTHGQQAPSSASSGTVKLGSDTNASGNVASGLSTDSAGSDGAHNNLQPFIVVYMWKRTA